MILAAVGARDVKENDGRRFVGLGEDPLVLENPIRASTRFSNGK